MVYSVLLLLSGGKGISGLLWLSSFGEITILFTGLLSQRQGHLHRSHFTVLVQTQTSHDRLKMK